MFQPIPKTLIPNLIKARVPVWLLVEEVLPNGGNKAVKTVRNIIARPKPERENYVLIENLTVPCNGKGQAEYLGQAFGQIHLKDNRIVPVSGKSDKPILLSCRISAK